MKNRIKDFIISSPFEPFCRCIQKWLNTLISLLGVFPFLYAFYHRPKSFIANYGNQLEIVMLAVSDLRIDPRVLRETKALALAGYKVKIIFPDISTPPLAEEPLSWGMGIEFLPIPRRAGNYAISYPFLLGRMIFNRAIQERPFSFHCHDLITSLIGIAAARKVGARCVCDFHEWWSENVKYDYWKKKYIPYSEKEKRFFKRVEKLIMAKVDAVIVVCESIAEELCRETTNDTRKVHVIRNIPPIETSDEEKSVSLRDQISISKDRLILLWQGGTGKGRNIEPIIEALAYAPSVTFVIRGPSLDAFGQGYRSIAERVGARERLILLDSIPSVEVVRGAMGADIGIWSLERLCKNFTYALPNKVFEYLAAGIPVMAANFPEVKKLVEDNGVGMCFDPDDPKSIGATLNHLSDNPKLRLEMRRRIPSLLQSLNAEKEWQKIVDLYDGLAAGHES